MANLTYHIKHNRDSNDSQSIIELLNDLEQYLEDHSVEQIKWVVTLNPVFAKRLELSCKLNKVLPWWLSVEIACLCPEKWLPDVPIGRVFSERE